MFSRSEPPVDSHSNVQDWEAPVRGRYGDWMASGQGMVEPIFYGADGAYDFQYLEMAERRYRNDKQWIEAHLGTSWESILEIARQLKQLAQIRVSRFHTASTFEEMSLQHLTVFLFSPEDIPNVSKDSMDSLFQAFALTPGKVNEKLCTIGGYNAVHSHPIIRLEHDRVLLPIFVNLAQSIYESPYYWMLKDRSYRKTGLANRGSATEEIGHELLARVFGEEHVYRGVKVRQRNQDVTDIDVLAVGGNKAVIVQAKSKKLTMASRGGDPESLKGDFEDAVQDAYRQALLSKKAVLEAGSSLTVGEELPVRLLEAIDDAYIICLTGDHYPAVTTQVGAYLQKQESDPYPLAMSIFDLDIVTFYLADPFDLLYYLRQRSAHATHFSATSEMALLAFHLHDKLYPTEEADATYIDQAYEGLIDANFRLQRALSDNTCCQQVVSSMEESGIR